MNSFGLIYLISLIIAFFAGSFVYSIYPKNRFFRLIQLKLFQFHSFRKHPVKQKNLEKEREIYGLFLEQQVRDRTKELEIVNNLLQEEIVKQKEYQEVIRSALLEELELNELKSRFISTASHEFRTPLTTVLSSVELLEKYGRNWDEADYFKQIKRIKRSVKNLSLLVDDVLMLGRTETGKISFEPKMLDFHKTCFDIIEETRSLLSNEHYIIFDYKLPRDFYCLDERLLVLIFSNLLSNAIKYSAEGGEVCFNVFPSEDHLVIEISDQGIGIPEEDQVSLFEPFNRGKNVGKIHGTGLGMSIVWKSVELHQGSVTFVSRVGSGTKFTVRIPVKQPE